MNELDLTARSVTYQKELKKFQAGIVEIRKVHNELTTLQLMVLLEVAARGQLNGKALEQLLGVHRATVSRTVGVLSNVKVSGRSANGLNLLRIDRDKINRRSNIITLTAKGHKVIQDVIKAMNHVLEV